MTDHSNFTKEFHHADLPVFKEISDEFIEYIGELKEVKQEECSFPHPSKFLF